MIRRHRPMLRERKCFIRGGALGIKKKMKVLTDDECIKAFIDGDRRQQLDMIIHGEGFQIN